MLTLLPSGCYRVVVEVINIKVPDGTKSRLRRLNRNVSALVREQIERLLEQRGGASVYERTAHLCGVIKGGPANMATSKDYLRQYGKKRAA